MNTDRFKFRVWDKRKKRYDDRYVIGSDGWAYQLVDVGDDWYDLISNEEVIIEQCTGLKDKNGKLIFEGDVLEVGINSMKCTMIYQDGCFWLDNGKSMYAIIVMMGSMEVIGNIHEEQSE